MAGGRTIGGDGRSRKPESQILGPSSVVLANAVRIARDQTVIADTPVARVDAFGYAIVVEPMAMFQATQCADYNADLWYTVTNGANSTVAFATGTSSTLLSLSDGGVSTNGHYAMRSSRYVPYIAAHGVRAEITFSLVAAATNFVQEVGFYEAPSGTATNGVYLRSTTSGYELVLASSVTGGTAETAVAQADWNEDPMIAGNTRSGAVLDPTKRTIMVVDLQWLATGQVRVFFDMGHDYDGPVLAHVFDNVNTGDKPYMLSATLPVTYLVRATGNVASKRSMRQICASVKSFGAKELPGVMRVVGRGGTALSVNTTRIPFVSFRCSSAYIPAIVQSIEMLSIAEPVRWDLVLNPTTLTGATFAGTVGRLQVDTAATVVAGGDVLESGYLAASSTGSRDAPGSKSSATKEKRWASISPAGTKDIITLCVQSLGAGATNVYSDLQVQEVS